jgi:hypothetical protein
MITAVSKVPLVRSSKERAISSIANTMPASGVLNAAATPAPPPAMMRPRSMRWRGKRVSQRRL